MNGKIPGILMVGFISLQAWGQDNAYVTARASDVPAITSAVRSDKLTEEDYLKLTKSGRLVLIDFYAPWCGPCKLMEPMLNELTEEQEGKVEVVRINVDENKALMRSMGIWEIPALKIYKEGKETWSRVGYTEKRVIDRQLKKL